MQTRLSSLQFLEIYVNSASCIISLKGFILEYLCKKFVSFYLFEAESLKILALTWVIIDIIRMRTMPLFCCEYAVAELFSRQIECYRLLVKCLLVSTLIELAIQNHQKLRHLFSTWVSLFNSHPFPFIPPVVIKTHSHYLFQLFLYLLNPHSYLPCSLCASCDDRRIVNEQRKTFCIFSGSLEIQFLLYF